MQQIADWLEKLGMSEYAQRFAENGIDVSVLPDLTDQDLKEDRRLARPSAKDASRRLRSLSVPLQAPPQPALYRAEAPRHCRAPASHGDVLGPSRFDGALGPHGP